MAQVTFFCIKKNKTKPEIEVKEKTSHVRRSNTYTELIYDKKRNKNFKIEPINLQTLARNQAAEEITEASFKNQERNTFDVVYTEKKLLSDYFDLKVTNMDLFSYIYFSFPTIPKEFILPRMVSEFEINFEPGRTQHFGIFLMKSISHVDYEAKNPFIPLILAASCMKIHEQETKSDRDDRSDYSLVIRVTGIVNKAAPVNYTMQIKSSDPQHKNFIKTVKKTIRDIRNKTNGYEDANSFILTPSQVTNITNNGEYPLRVFLQFDKGPTVAKNIQVL